MNSAGYRSEIRPSEIRALLEKVKKHNYAEYLLSLRLERIRQFQGVTVNFDFPVTALIGPNGSGKSTILGAAACIYRGVNPKTVFRKSRIGDDAMDDWRLEYELIHKESNPNGTMRETATFKGNEWQRSDEYRRTVKVIGIGRTVPAGENPLFSLKKRLSIHGKLKAGHKAMTQKEVGGIEHIKTEAEKILGRSLKDFQLFEITYEYLKLAGGRKRFLQSRVTLPDGREQDTWLIKEKAKTEKVLSATQRMYVGNAGEVSYSEFSFGSGEASVIHVVADIEGLPDGSLVLFEEIENGLHPLAVCRLVDYLISASLRKNLQVLFTTHSDYALIPLPSEAIWASVDGRVEQGKLSIELLRAVSGRIDRRLAIFVEDNFAADWIQAIVRERLGESAVEIGVYPLHGDGNAVRIHSAHLENPAVDFNSICFIDGDSRQKDDEKRFVFRLPGEMPESKVFDDVVANLEKNVALLTVACQRPVEKQNEVTAAIQDVARTNRDPHLLFNQVGTKIGFVPEATVAGAFIAVWIAEHREETDNVAAAIRQALAFKKQDHA